MHKEENSVARDACRCCYSLG